MRKYLRIFEITPGGWLLLSVLFFFADYDVFLIVILCVLIHESGHLLTLGHFKVRVRKITLDYTGLTIWYNESFLCGLTEAAAALSGPMFGLIAAGVGARLGELFHSDFLYMFAGGNLVLSVFNLLPAKPLDGWRCLRAFFPGAAQIISICTALAVLAIGIFVMYAGYGTALAIMGIILLLQDTSAKKSVRRHITAS